MTELSEIFIRVSAKVKAIRPPPPSGIRPGESVWFGEFSGGMWAWIRSVSGRSDHHNYDERRFPTEAEALIRDACWRLLPDIRWCQIVGNVYRLFDVYDRVLSEHKSLTIALLLAVEKLHGGGQ